MTTAFFMLGVIALIGWTVFLLDWLGRRKERQDRGRPAA